MNMLMPQGGQPMAPQGAPGPMPGAPPAQQPPSAEQIAGARQHMQVVAAGLMDLAKKPKGSLSKRDVFNAIGEMIAQGAFSTPEAKQQLVAKLAEMPDDETAIRQIIGSQLLQMATMTEQMDQHFPMEG